MTDEKRPTIHERLDLLETRFSRLEKRLFWGTVFSCLIYTVLGVLQRVA